MIIIYSVRTSKNNKELVMKKMLTLSLLTGLLVSLSFSQFTTGTKSVSSVFSYNSAKWHRRYG